MNIAIDFAERRLIPDSVLRAGIRNLLRKRLASEVARHRAPNVLDDWTRMMAGAPIALSTAVANEQHYEVPAAFFEAALGPRMKYSSCHWDQAIDLASAEEEMLALTAERARLEDGQDVLELGCGWGSLSLWMAKSFPNSRITGVSNSASQRAFIMSRARLEGLDNLEILTADMNDFSIDRRFDRVVSVEMFEHIRNWQRLLSRIHGWLEPDGLLFLHFFAHRRFAYSFETTGDDDWMGKNFFTGGMMPSADLLSHLSIPFHVATRWDVNGTHYARTAEAWLDNLDRRSADVLALFARDMERSEARRAVQRWRIFFMACAELFGWDKGREWLVTHALLAPRAKQVA